MNGPKQRQSRQAPAVLTASLTLCLATLLSSALAAQRPSAEEMEFLREGVRHHNAGEYDAAVARYLKALEVDPKSGVAHYQISYARQSQGAFDKCLEWADKGLRSGSLAARMNLFVVAGSCAESLGQSERAVELFEQGLTEFPGRTLLTMNFAVTLAHLEQNQRALQLLRTGLENDRGHASSHRLVALIAGLEGHDDLALMAAVRFLSLEPEGARAPEMLGVVESLLRRGESTGNAAESEETGSTAGEDGTAIGSLRLEQPKNEQEEQELIDRVLSATRIAAELAPDGRARFPEPDRVGDVEQQVGSWASRATSGTSATPSPFAPSSPAVALLELKRSYRAFYARVVDVDASSALAHFALQSIGGDELVQWPRTHQDALQRLFRMLAKER